MNRQEFYNRVTNSKIDLIGEFLTLLHKNQISYCVVGGIAVNAYCEPIVTLDFDCVVAMGQVEKLKKELKRIGLKVKAHPHTYKITHKASDVRIQLQRDERYQAFIKKAESREVLGYRMKIARREDILVLSYPELERLLTEEIKENPNPTIRDYKRKSFI